MKRIYLVIAVCLFFVLGELGAGAIDNREQLEKIRQRIENTQVDLAEKKQEERGLLHDLSMLRQTLKSINGRIASLEKDQRALEQEIVQQERSLEKSRGEVRQTGRRLEKRLVALYKEGEAGLLRILFSADSPTELVQQYQYVTRVMGADKNLLEDFRQAVASQKAQLAQLEQSRRKQQQLITQEQKQRADAVEGKRLQASLLKKVRSDKRQLNRELASLEEKAKRLESLVRKLNTAPSTALPGGRSFSAGKGSLSWPVMGALLIGFGTQKDADLGTLYESNGIEISASPGSQIRAVADGRVVFADWFKGYGNLLILSHPGGFHTLYAQAAELGKSVGDQVQAGDVVATSGLNGRDGIYFEIRQNGAPVNPLLWLQRL